MSAVLSINSSACSSLDNEPKQSILPADPRVASTALSVILGLGAVLAVNYLILSYVGPNFTLLLCSGFLVLSLAHVVYVVARDHLFPAVHGDDPLKQDRKAGWFAATHTVMHAGLSSLIHECGHAVSAWMLLVKAGPKITIHPFRGGSTSYAVSYGLTSVGKFFGKEFSLGLIKAAGMISSTLCATIALVFANSIQDSHPQVSQGFEFAAVSMIISELVNGLTTLVVKRSPLYYTAMAVAAVAALALSKYVEPSHPQLSHWLVVAAKVAVLNELINWCWNFGVSTKRLSNDYINLWVNYEIHPAIPMGLVGGIPIAVKLFLDWYKPQKGT